MLNLSGFIDKKPADRTALPYSAFAGHVTSSSRCQSFRTKPLSLTVSEIVNVKCNAMDDVTLMRPLNKGHGHSFWYQSISHIRSYTFRITSPLESTPFFIPSTSLCSLSFWFTSSYVYHLITVITFVLTICHALHLSHQT